MKKATLVLADGTSYQGKAFGSTPLTYDQLQQQSETDTVRGFGEVVFNTSMTGYHEILTDPSYTGQIVLMTYPHIGNYGDDASWSETGPEQEESRKKIKARALIVRDVYEGPVPPGRESLETFLRSNEIPAISDIDTRALTLQLRDHGSVNGIIVSGHLENGKVKKVAEKLSSSSTMTGKNLIGGVGITSPVPMTQEGDLHFGLFDCGIKHNIIRELKRRNVRITLFPSSADFEQMRELEIDALFISNGPGDPGVLTHQTHLIEQAIGTIPVFGICLGHQLIAQALGAKTFKMKFGHHGANHPVRDEITGKVFVTSQNHGFSVDPESLPEDAGIWFTNANDGSVEGLIHATLPVMSVQFHPEAAPGPHDGGWIFDRFVERAQTFYSSST